MCEQDNMLCRILLALLYRESSITHRHLFNQILQKNAFDGKVYSMSVKCYKCKMASHDQFFSYNNINVDTVCRKIDEVRIL